MIRRCAVVAALVVGACSNPGGDANLDARMKPMVGANEPALLAAMGRAPDASTDTAPGVKLLQWRYQKDYAISDRTLRYSYAGGTIKPIPNTHTGMVSDDCVAEWTVERGVATHYRLEGTACQAVAELATP